MALRTRVRETINRFGYDVHRLTGDLGQDPYRDIAKLAGAEPALVCIDVGANVGQTIRRLRSALNRPEIHAFEPAPDAFAELRGRTSDLPGVHLNDCAVGSAAGVVDLIERAESDMSSLLEPGPEPMGSIKSRIPVQVRTLDDYFAERGLRSIELIKSDTQGYDLEVLRGASAALAAGAVHLILIEINLNEAYAGLPRFDQIYGFLHDHEFRLVSFYNAHFGVDRVSWMDALFIGRPSST